MAGPVPGLLADKIFLPSRSPFRPLPPFPRPLRLSAARAPSPCRSSPRSTARCPRPCANELCTPSVAHSSHVEATRAPSAPGASTFRGRKRLNQSLWRSRSRRQRWSRWDSSWGTSSSVRFRVEVSRVQLSISTRSLHPPPRPTPSSHRRTRSHRLHPLLPLSSRNQLHDLALLLPPPTPGRPLPLILLSISRRRTSQLPLPCPRHFDSQQPQRTRRPQRARPIARAREQEDV